MQTAEQVYRHDVAPLPLAERLRLASLILRDAADQFPPAKDSLVDESDTWSEDDLREWSAATRERFGSDQGNSDGAIR